MKKSITKINKGIHPATKVLTSRKRPKSVLRKAWETRRKNAKHRASPEHQMNEMFFGDKADTSKLPGIAGLAKATPTSETATPRFEMTAQEWVEIADHISFLKERGFAVAKA